MPSLYLNSFHPLVKSRAGVSASEKFNIPPFVDGSIRREPDFEHATPVITCLCRGRMFTPRLQPGDVVAYITVKGKYLMRQRHQRMVCVLIVERLFDSHKQAAEWFKKLDLPLPNNLMVPGNKANPLSKSHRGQKQQSGCAKPICGTGGCGSGCGSIPDGTCGSTVHSNWDTGYRLRAKKYGRVVACSILYKNVQSSAPIITDEILFEVFGKIPATRNPGRLDLRLLPKLMSQLGIRIPPSSP